MDVNAGVAAQEAEPMDVEEAKPLVYVPLTMDESMNRDLDEIHARRFRMIAEINQRLDAAYEHGLQEYIWYLEDQLEWWTNVI